MTMAESVLVGKQNPSQTVVASVLTAPDNCELTRQECNQHKGGATKQEHESAASARLAEQR